MVRLKVQGWPSTLEALKYCFADFQVHSENFVSPNTLKVKPLEVAFPTVTFGIFMVLMVLLGGKGTLWGPVIGAIIFHVIKEITWTYLLGWQWVALGALIIINVVYFQQGIMGWAQEKWPELFGITVDEAIASPEENSLAEKEVPL